MSERINGKRIEEKIDRIEKDSYRNFTAQNPHVQNSGVSLRIAALILYPFVLFYVFMKVGIPGVDIIGNALANFLSILKVDNVLGIMSGEAYLGLIVMFVLFFVYIDFFLSFPLTYILSLRRDPMERITSTIKWEGIIVVFLIVPLLISITLSSAGGDDGSVSEEVKNFKVDTKSKINKLFEGPLCYLFNDPSTCYKNEGTQDADESTRSEFEIYFKKPDYSYVENLERFKKRPYYLNYEVMAKGKPLYIERIECYANEIDGDNLLSNISFEDKKILSNERLPVSGIKCNLNDLEIDSKLDENFKLVTLLYYNIESIYTKPIHVVDVDRYIQNHYASREGLNMVEIEKEIRDNIENNEPIKSNNVLDFKTYTSPKLPYFLGEDYNNENGYYFSFTIKKEGVLSDKIVDNKLINYSIPEIMNIVCEEGYNCREDFNDKISTYNDKSHIDFNLKINQEDFDREEFIDKIEFNMKTSFRKKNIISLVINNPSYEEEKEEEDKETNSSEGQTNTSNEEEEEEEEGTNNAQSEDEQNLDGNKDKDYDLNI